MMHSGSLNALLVLQSAGGMGSTPFFLVQVAAILAIFYFFLIRPQAAQRKKHEAALSALKRGDQIVTFGGIIGEVVHIKEMGESSGTGGAAAARRALEDQITIKSAESRLIVERGKIARIIGGTSAPDTKA